MINEIKAYPVSFRHNNRKQIPHPTSEPPTSNSLPTCNSRFFPTAVLIALLVTPCAVGCNNSAKDPFARELEKFEQQGSTPNVEFGPDGDIEALESKW